MVTPRLVVELVPRPCWWTNVKGLVPRARWDAIRSWVSDQAGARCEVCGGRGSRYPVECHEVWEYDDAAHVQTLVRMIALCPPCHHVCHFGLHMKRGFGRETLEHLARVNGWDIATAQAHVDAAFKQWRERSAHAWSVDLSVLEGFGLEEEEIAELTEKARSRRASGESW